MEQDLSRVVDGLPGLVWTALPDGEIDFLNQRWCEYTGLTQSEARGFGWRAAIHPDDLSGLLETWSASLASGAPRDAEARLRRFDGVYRWFHFGTAPLADAQGRTLKWVGINTDIEARKQAEAKLRASEQRSRSIIDGLPANLMLMTPEGMFADGNRQMMDYFGTPFEELRTLPVDAKIHPDDRPELMRRWAHSLASGEDCDTEARFLKANGEITGSAPWACRCATTTAGSSCGTCCRPISTTASGPKCSSPARNWCWRWWRRAGRWP